MSSALQVGESRRRPIGPALWAPKGLSAPWGQPRGLAGRFAGWEMSRGKLRVSELVAEQLGLDEASTVVEVGFGPGVVIAYLSERFPHVRFAGAERSEIMICQAMRRNRAACLEGRCDLRLARAERLPFADQGFAAAFTLNSIGFWTSPRDGLAELARVLVPGGKLFIGLRGQAEGHAKPHSKRHQLEQLTATLQAVGFATPTIRDQQPGARTMTTLLARRLSR